jgi:hypothetical protein
MLNVNATLTGCPADCDDALLYPAIAADQYCTNYPQGRSQIGHIVMRPTGAPDPLTSWGSNSSATPTATANAIDNSNALNTKSKRLAVIGGLPVPEVTVTQYPLRQEKDTDKRYTLEATYYQLDADSYEFLRQVKCGKINFTFYYEDLSDYIYGISGGLVPYLVKVVFPKSNANDGKNIAIIRISFRATGSPQRRANPLA